MPERDRNLQNAGEQSCAWALCIAAEAILADNNQQPSAEELVRLFPSEAAKLTTVAGLSCCELTCGMCGITKYVWPAKARDSEKPDALLGGRYQDPAKCELANDPCQTWPHQTLNAEATKYLRSNNSAQRA